MKISISGSTTAAQQHTCTSRREGDWLVYTCPDCPQYERRLHLVSGKMTIRPSHDTTILHQGQYVAPALDISGSTPN